MNPRDRGLWRRVLRRIHADPELQKLIHRRDQHALLGVAAAFSEVMPRREARRIARACNVAFVVFDWLRTHGPGWPALTVEGEDHVRAGLAAGKGVIIAPVHLTRYQDIPPYFLGRGHRIALLVDEPNLSHFEAQTSSSTWDQSLPAATPDDAVIVSSGSPAALWKLACCLRENRAVFMFVDGNSGLHHRADRSCLELMFLGRRIAVRTGIAALASTTGAPIIRAVTDELETGPRLRFEAPIRREPGEADPAFRARAMAELFGWMEELVRAAPHLWEEWPTFPRWLLDDARPRPSCAAPASIPALVGHRLTIADPWVWAMERSDGPTVVDASSGTPLARGGTAAGLLTAAERRADALAWLRAQDDVDGAFSMMQLLVGTGVIALERAA